MTDNFFKIAPFKIYSSSVDTGYATEISSSFKSGLDITNMHTDRYADMNDAPIQSPFTYRFVGGSQHRHVPLNDGTDTPTTRPELFNLSMSAGTLKVVGPDFYDSSRPRAYYFRDTFAKRPVNVANFKIATGSSEIGNYLNDYEILQTVGRTTNNKAFIEATGSGFAQYVTTHYVTGAKDPDRTLPVFSGSSGQYIFVNRFNAPGGTEVSSRGVLDTYAEEYAPNNAMPWRNRSVRSLLRSDLARHTPKAGIGVPTTYHNDNRNKKVGTVFDQIKLLYGESSEVGSPESIEYDEEDDRIYWNTGTIKRGPLNPTVAFGSQVEDVVSGYSATSFAIDKKERKLYFSYNAGAGVGLSIVSTNLDGSDPTTPFSATSGFSGATTNANQLLIDDVNRNIYIVSSDSKLYRVSLDDASVAHLNPNSIYHSIQQLSLDKKGQHLYYTDPQIYYPSTYRGMIRRVNVSPVSGGPFTSTAGTQPLIRLDFPTSYYGSQVVLIDENSESLFYGHSTTAAPCPNVIRRVSLKKLNDLPPFDPSSLTTFIFQTTHEKTIGDIYATFENNPKYLTFCRGGIATACQDTVFPFEHCEDNTIRLIATKKASYDNGFVNREIPQSDIRYRWISDSAITTEYELPGHQNSSSVPFGAFDDITFFSASGNSIGSVGPSGPSYYEIGGEFRGDYIGISGSAIDKGAISIQTTTGSNATNLLSRTNDTSFFVYDGPYQHPSWKQVRGSQNPVVRQLVKESILSLANRPKTIKNALNKQVTSKRSDGITNFREPVISEDARPSVHTLLVRPSLDSQLQLTSSVKYTLANDVTTFTNQKIRDILGIKRNLDSSFYKKLKDTYLEPEVVNTSANPVDGFLDMSYSRVLYPSPINAFLNTTRERTEYSEVAGTGSDGYDRVFGTQRTFYKDNLIRTSGAKNSQGASGAPVFIDAQETLSSANFNLQKDRTSQFTQDENYAIAPVFVFGTNTLVSNVSTRFFKKADVFSGESKASFKIMRGPATLNGSVSLGAPVGSITLQSTNPKQGYVGNEILLHGLYAPSYDFNLGNVSIASNSSGLHMQAFGSEQACYFISSSLELEERNPVTGSYYRSADSVKGTLQGDFALGALDSAYIALAAPYDDTVATNAGIAYLIHSTSVGFSENILTASDGEASDQFGFSVSVASSSAGVYCLAGAPGTTSGSAYLYHSTSAGIAEQKLTASDGDTNDEYGDSVSVVSNTSDEVFSLVGAYRHNSHQGAAYLYRSSSAGIAEQKLTASDGLAGDRFGSSVSIASGSTGVYCLVGAHLRHEGATNDAGAAYLYHSTSAGIVEDILVSASPQAGSQLGTSVSVFSGSDGVFCLAGAPPASSIAGSASLFYSSSGGIVEDILTSSTPSVGDRFGYRVSVVSGTDGVHSFVAQEPDANSLKSSIFHSTSLGITEQTLTSSIHATFHSQSVDIATHIPAAEYRDAYVLYSGSSQVYFYTKDFGSITSDNIAISSLVLSGSRSGAPVQTLNFNCMSTDGIYSYPDDNNRNRDGELMLDNTITAFSETPMPSLGYLENYYNVVADRSTGYVERLTEQIAGKNPWYDTYGEYAADVRPHSKNKSIIPEFRMSEHISYYVAEKGDLSFRSENKKFLSLDGASITSSANDEDDCTFDPNFINRYARTTDSGRLVEIAEEHSDGQVGEISRVEFSCKALKKLLPYNGFYPKDRTVQIGNLLSQSLAPYVSATYNDSGSYPAQALMSVIKPLMSPGILYNTIKSGVAVEYPIYTGSVPGAGQTGSFSDMSLDTPGNYRLPFETLIDLNANFPQGSANPIRFVSSFDTGGEIPLSDVLNFSTVWSGTKLSLFELGMHNFLAESVSFFLEGESLSAEGKLTSFRSKPQPPDGWQFDSSKTYYMDVILRDTLEMNKFINYSGSTGAGADQQDYKQNGKLFGIGISGTLDPAYVAYTPPMFYGESVARIKFSPPTTATYTLSEIFEQAEVTETLNLNQDRVATVSGSKLSLNSIQEQSRMSLSASVNMFGTFLEPEVSFDPETGAPTLISETSNLNPSWVISTRYECPVLEMSSSRYNELYTAYVPDSTVETALGFDSSTIKRTNPRTMWTSYGQPPTGSKKITLELANSFPDYKENPAHASLIDTCGFTAGDKAIGKVRGTKKVSEAIVMIPYLDEPIAGVTTEIEGKNFIAIDSPDTTRYSDQRNNLERFGYAVQAEQNKGEKIEHTSITRMIKGMQMFNMPPNMDFYKHSDITPFVMYFFPFSTDLTRTELADIWQGVMPQSAMRTENDMVDVSHDVNNFEFFGNLKDRTLISKMRFMVFKVKQVAKQNYFEITEDATDDSRYQFKFSADGQAAAVPHPSYNWPYDYFSLVEDATIEAKYTIKNNSEE